jgi:hypothetical protein
MLLFARVAQGTHGLRPLALAGAPSVRAWRVDGFLVNRDDRPVTLTVDAPASGYQIDRMTPRDPTGRGRTLDAPQVRIDGRTVAPDGTWPGFRPQTGAIAGGRLRVALGAAEAAVITLHE